MIKGLFPSWLIVTAGLTVFAGGARAATGGAIPVQVNIPDMAQKGWAYQVALPHGGSMPVDGRLTELSWHYELIPASVPVSAWLCTPSECVALEMVRGSTNAFTGLPASTPLSLHFVLPGKGMLKRPVHGGTAQVFVNYQMEDR